MTPCIWLGTTHPCNPPHYGLWVNLYFFTMCIYKNCLLPMLLVFAMKCCNKMLCPLPHNHYCCSLPSPVHLYMPHLFTHCLPTSICVMLMFFFLCIFFIFVICYISLWFICFVYFFELMSNVIFDLFFKFTCLFLYCLSCNRLAAHIYIYFLRKNFINVTFHQEPAKLSQIAKN